jgi:hypothetical protein
MPELIEISLGLATTTLLICAFVPKLLTTARCCWVAVCLWQ